MEQGQRKRELEAQLARCRALADEPLGEVTKQNLRYLEAQIQRELEQLAALNTYSIGGGKNDHVL
jgi:hypothetical protein